MRHTFFSLQGYTHHHTLTCFPLALFPLLHITYSPTQRFFRCFPFLCFFCILPVTIKWSLFSYFFSKLEITNDAKKFDKVLYLSLNRFEKVYSPHQPSLRKHWYGFKCFIAILRANSFSRKTSSFKSTVVTRIMQYWQHLLINSKARLNYLPKLDFPTYSGNYGNWT